MRYQVPQFVDIEDKIVGPLTLRQFVMYLVAVLLLIPVFLFSDLGLFITIALPTLATAAAFAHVKIQGQTLATLLGNAVFFYTGSQLYTWQRTAKRPELVVKDAAWEELALAREESSADLRSLIDITRTLETGGSVVQSEEVVDEFDPAR